MFTSSGIATSQLHAGVSATGEPATTQWWGSTDFSHTNQNLDTSDSAVEPMPVGRELFLQMIGRIPTRVPIPELRGLRITWGMRQVWAVIADIAGKQGDRCFASNRYIAAMAGVSVRTVQHARQMARAAGLLIRQTHGAGKAKPGSYKAGGAVDVLAFPGGVDGARALKARLLERANLISRARKRIIEDRNAHIQAQVDLLLKTEPWIAKRIADALGQPRSVEGAQRVLFTVLGRAPRRIRNAGAYVMAAIKNDPGTLTGLWPQQVATAQSVHQGKMAHLLAHMSKSLAPPG